MYCLSIILIFKPLPESRRNSIGPVFRSLIMQLAMQTLGGVTSALSELKYLRGGLQTIVKHCNARHQARKDTPVCLKFNTP